MRRQARGNDLDLTASALTGLAVLATACAVVSLSARYQDELDSLDRHAAEYVQLVGGLQVHDPDSVDFHSTADAPPARPPALTAIAVQSRSLAVHVRQSHLQGAEDGEDGEDGERTVALAAQLDAVAARADQLSGVKLTFDAEKAQLFALDQWVMASKPGSKDRDQLQRLLPGDEPLPRRLATYQRRFTVPRAHLHASVTRSLALCRSKALRFMSLPKGESLSVEYVADRPWSGYSVYLGGYRSVMQVNRVLPLSVNDVLTLACHEGYPGHHVLQQPSRAAPHAGEGLDRIERASPFQPGRISR